LQFAGELEVVLDDVPMDDIVGDKTHNILYRNLTARILLGELRSAVLEALVCVTVRLGQWVTGLHQNQFLAAEVVQDML
jgi:hypothetical protein